MSENFSNSGETEPIRPLELVADEIVRHLLEGGPEDPDFRANLSEWMDRTQAFIDNIDHAPSRQKRIHEMNLNLGRIYERAGYYEEAMENYYQVYQAASEFIQREEAKAELERLLSLFEGGELELMQVTLTRIKEEFNRYLN